MFKKKIMALGLALTMSFSLFGCGSGSGNATEAATAAGNEGASAEVSTDGYWEKSILSRSLKASPRSIASSQYAM